MGRDYPHNIKKGQFVRGPNGLVFKVEEVGEMMAVARRIEEDGSLTTMPSILVLGTKNGPTWEYVPLEPDLATVYTKMLREAWAPPDGDPDPLSLRARLAEFIRIGRNISDEHDHVPPGAFDEDYWLTDLRKALAAEGVLPVPGEDAPRGPAEQPQERAASQTLQMRILGLSFDKVAAGISMVLDVAASLHSIANGDDISINDPEAIEDALKEARDNLELAVREFAGNVSHATASEDDSSHTTTIHVGEYVFVIRDEEGLTADNRYHKGLMTHKGT